jgi:hypothetical protein
MYMLDWLLRCLSRRSRAPALLIVAAAESGHSPASNGGEWRYQVDR